MLMTEENWKSLPPLYSQEKKANGEAIVYVKFFCPWNQWTWYITEGRREEKLLFGYVVGLENEYGYVSLEELESVTGPGGLRIERDRHFTPCPLNAISALKGQF